MNVQLISRTTDAEDLMAFCARVSSDYQENPEYSKLLGFCIRNGHWSVFEQAHMTLEITTSRAIAAQILRHRSFSFQEFSQRYSSAIDTPMPVVGRQQATKNRQSSTIELDTMAQEFWQKLQERVYETCYTAYHQALASGVAREQARFLLPLSTPSKLYVCGNVRSWIHYLKLRTQPDTQQEHRQVALAAKDIFVQQFPETSKALEWT